MRPDQSVLKLAVCLSSLSPLASAWGWPGWAPEIDSIVVRRAASESSTSTGSQDSTSPTDGTTLSATGTDKSSGNTASKTVTGTDSTGATKTGKSSGTGTHKTTGKATHTEFAPDSPIGAVQILTPATNAEPTVLFKIKDDVTFGWNYTNLQGTPTAVDVLVSCQVASATWTLTQNMTFETAAKYVWDTEKQASDPESPLLTEMYTLIIKDSDTAITDPPQPGYLGTFSGFKFGMYTPQPYTPYPDWSCTGCSDAASLFSHQALGLAMTMSVVTFFSFTWFVSGLGLH